MRSFTFIELVVIQVGSLDDDVQDKLSEEELAERMARIREQNEKIKQRRAVSLLVVLISIVVVHRVIGCRGG